MRSLRSVTLGANPSLKCSTRHLYMKSRTKSRPKSTIKQWTQLGGHDGSFCGSHSDCFFVRRVLRGNGNVGGPTGDILNRNQSFVLTILIPSISHESRYRHAFCDTMLPVTDMCASVYLQHELLPQKWGKTQEIKQATSIIL